MLLDLLYFDHCSLTDPAAGECGAAGGSVVGSSPAGDGTGSPREPAASDRHAQCAAGSAHTGPGCYPP